MLHHRNHRWQRASAAALKVADRGYVLETGRITLEGAGDALRRNPEVRAASLGKS